MEEFVASNLQTFGPIAVFVLIMLSGVGIPLGEDIIAIPAGVLVGHGTMKFWPTVLATYTGVVLSDCLWFTLVHRYGTSLLHRRWFKRAVHPRRLLEAKHQAEKRGVWMIVTARFIPASRTTAITVAALLHMPFWKFAAATASCALITAPMQVGLGVLIARSISGESTAGLIRAILISIAVLAVGLMVLNWMRAQRREGRPPRAKARWLRRFRRRRNIVDDAPPDPPV